MTLCDLHIHFLKIIIMALEMCMCDCMHVWRKIKIRNYVLFLFASGALSPLNCPGLLEPAPVCTPSFTSDLLCSVLSLVTGEKEGGRRIQEMEQSRIGGAGLHAELPRWLNWYSICLERRRLRV